MEKVRSRIKGWDYRKVRSIMLSVGRGGSAEETYLKIAEGKRINNLLRNLKRNEKSIKEYVWVLEWHKDGFPHWHVLVLTENGDKLTGDLIRDYWEYGDWIREGYFKDKDHWNHIVGYFAKKGYFEKGKGYQMKLPVWALDWSRAIRKYGMNVVETVKVKIENEKKRKKLKTLMEKAEGIVKVRRKYGVIIEDCGSTCWITIEGQGLGWGYRSNIPYAVVKEKFKTFKWVDGVGLVGDLTSDEIMDLTKYEDVYRIKKYLKKSDIDAVEIRGVAV